MTQSAADFVYASDAGNAGSIANGVTAANHCWTAVHARPDAADTKRVAIGGYAGSITTCLKHAVDGYSFWGVTLMVKLGKDWVKTAIATTDVSLPLS